MFVATDHLTFFQSRNLVQQEMERMNLDTRNKVEDGLLFAEERAKLKDRFQFIRDQVIDKVMAKDSPQESDLLIQDFNTRFDLNREHMLQQATTAAKIEKKLSITLGGYQARSLKLRQKIQSDYDRLVEANVQLSSFQFLYEQERESIPKRVNHLKHDITLMEERERDLQIKYQNLMSEKQDLVAAAVAEALG
jgi:pre-mRNA-splicing factor CDC5/CEF1